MWADTLSFELLKENMCKQNLYFGVILRVFVSVSSQTAESFGDGTLVLVSPVLVADRRPPGLWRYYNFS